MRIAIMIVLVVCFCFTAALGVADERSEKLDKQAYEIYQQVFSPFCPGRSLNDCPSSKAHELKTELRQRLENGDPPKAILDDVFARFGDQYRAVPVYSGFGKLVWWAPIGFFAIGLFVAAGVALSRKRSAEAVKSTQRQTLTDEMKVQIERELSSLE